MNRSVYRILVAEDEVIARRALRLICERSACPVKVVSEASTGRQVVEALDVVRPDIILMDIVLPGMNGLEATRVIHERFPATRVAIVSANEKCDYAQQALRAGAVDYLLKPISPEQLETLLQKLCAALDAERIQQGSLARSARGSQPHFRKARTLMCFAVRESLFPLTTPKASRWSRLPSMWRFLPLISAVFLSKSWAAHLSSI